MSDSARDEQTAGRSMLRESGKLSILTMISRVLGLLREITRVNLLGTSVLGESFTTAFNTPNLFRKLLAEGAMSTALIPTMKEYFSSDDRQKTEDFLSATFTVLIFVTGLVVALGMAGATYIALLYAGMSPDPEVLRDTAQTAALIRLMFPYLAMVAVAAYLQGILNAHAIFVPSGLGPILFNLSFLAVPPLLVLWVPNPARAMAYGVLVGGALQALCQLPRVLRLGQRFRLVSLGKAFANPGMKKVLLLMAPTLLGMAVYEINGFVSTGLAYGVGAATSIQLSLRLQELILGVFVVSIGTVLLPDLSGLASGRRWEEFSQRFRRALEAVILVTLPVVVFVFLQRVNIVAVLFQTGAFGPDSVAATARIFLFHNIGLLFIAMNRLIAPAFYACQDTRSPTWAGVVAFVVNMALAWVLAGPFGGSGIAVALSVASAVNTLLLIVLFLRKPIDGLGSVFPAVFRYLARIAGLSVLAALPVWLVGPGLQALFSGFSSRFAFAGLPLLLCSLAYGLLGIGLLKLTRDPVAAYLFAALRRRSRPTSTAT